jgi:hypothetical protein
MPGEQRRREPAGADSLLNPNYLGVLVQFCDWYGNGARTTSVSVNVFR